MHLPHLHSPIKLLHLSDLHLGDPLTVPEVVDAVQPGLAERPDLIVLTGDYVYGHGALRDHRLEDAVAALARVAPVYAVLGNHDGGAWGGAYGDWANEPVRRRLEQGGAVVLENSKQVVTVRGQELLLVGVGDLWSQTMNPAKAFRQAPKNVPTILLAHNPDTKDQVESFDWHLLLAGHTHGNQVNLPLFDEPWATVRDHRFIAGLHAWSGRQLFINRGLGGVRGIRFNSRPELSILELAP